MDDTELRNLIISTYKAKIESGEIQPKIKVIVEENGRKVPKLRPVANAEEYFTEKFNRMRANLPDTNDHGILTLIAKDAELGINLHQMTAAPVVTDGEYTNIGSLRLGNRGLTIKAKVLGASIKPGTTTDKKTKQPRAYKRLWMSLGDATGTTSCTIFNDESNADVFEAAELKQLIGKTVVMTNADFITNDPQYPPNIRLGTGGSITIRDDEQVETITTITEIKDLNPAMKNVTLMGKIAKKSEVKEANNEKKSKYCTFLLVDKTGSIAAQAWNEAAYEVPPNDSIVTITNARFSWEDEFRKKQPGWDPKMITVFAGSIQANTEVNPDEWASVEAKGTAGGSTVFELQNARAGDVFEGIVYLDHFKSVKWDAPTRTWVPTPIYGLECAKDHGDSEESTYVFEREDHTLFCKACNAIISPSQTRKRLRLEAQITDGSVWFTTKIRGNNANVIFGIPEDKLIEDYIAMGHAKFFGRENEMAGGKVYKVRAKIVVNAWGVSLQLFNIEAVTLEDAIAFEQAKLQPPAAV